MSDHVEGIVAKISEKPTSNGGTIYNICLEIDGSDDEWFGHGFDEPIFQEGDEIEFDIEYNGDYCNVDKDTVVIISEGEPKPKSRGRSSGGRSGGGNSRGSSRGSSKPAGRSSGGRSGGGGRGRGKPAAKPSRGSGGGGKSKSDAPATMSKEEWAQKDQIIRRQACMNTAINLIGTAVKCELVALPTKKADKLDAFIALCDEEAERLYDQYEEQVYGKKEQKRGSRSSRNDDYDDDIPE